MCDSRVAVRSQTDVKACRQLGAMCPLQLVADATWTYYARHFHFHTTRLLCPSAGTQLRSPASRHYPHFHAQTMMPDARYVSTITRVFAISTAHCLP
jgi:hypothetical protein